MIDAIATRRRGIAGAITTSGKTAKKYCVASLVRANSSLRSKRACEITASVRQRYIVTRSRWFCMHVQQMPSVLLSSSTSPRMHNLRGLRGCLLPPLSHICVRAEAFHPTLTSERQSRRCRASAVKMTREMAPLSLKTLQSPREDAARSIGACVRRSFRGKSSLQASALLTRCLAPARSRRRA